MGPPGSGKGTQAQLLSQTLRVPHISTGELFRQHISEQSELGLLAKTYLDTGELVPSAVTSEMVRDRLTDETARPGFLLDGFPRTLEQVIALDEILDEQHHELTAVLDF
jgi:adenylate kinase